jgi:hypothetical protein
MLKGSDLFFHVFSRIGSSRAADFLGQQKPRISRDHINADSVSVVVGGAHVEHGIHVFLYCRLAIPFDGFNFVLLHAKPQSEHQTNIILSDGISLFCRRPVPFHSKRVALRLACASFVSFAKSNLGARVA